MENKLDELYKNYGVMMLKLEILQNQIMECKRAIVEEMKKPKESEEEK